METDSRLSHHRAFGGVLGGKLWRAGRSCRSAEASRAFFIAPPPGFADRPLLGPRAALYIAPPDDDGALPALAAEFDAGGVALPATRCGARSSPVGDPRPEWRTAAIIEPDCYRYRCRGAARGLSARVGRKPVITDARSDRNDARQRRLDDRRTRAGPMSPPTTIVNAAGAWADAVAALAGARPRGLQPLRRTMAVLAIDPPPPADLPMMLDANGRFYFKPDGGRLWLSPHDETPDVAHDVRPDELDLAIVIDRFEQATHRARSSASKTAGRACAPSPPTACRCSAGMAQSTAFSGAPGKAASASRPRRPPADLCAALLLGAGARRRSGALSGDPIRYFLNGSPNFGSLLSTGSVSVCMKATSAALSAAESPSRCGLPPGPCNRLSSAGPACTPLL